MILMVRTRICLVDLWRSIERNTVVTVSDESRQRLQGRDTAESVAVEDDRSWRAMAGILPEAVRWRRGKSDLSGNLCSRLPAGDHSLLNGIIV